MSLRLLSALILAAACFGAEVLEAPLVPVEVDPERERGMDVDICIEPLGAGCFPLPFVGADGLIWLVRPGTTAPPAQRVIPAHSSEPGVVQRYDVPLGDRTIPYALRSAYGGKDYHYVHGLTVLEARLGERRLRILDCNGDGRFGQFGIDGIRIGDGVEADCPGYRRVRPLARTLALDGVLYEVVFAGDRLRLTPFTGPVARVKLILPAAGPPFLPVPVRAVAELARADDQGWGALSTTDEVLVPAGDYLLGNWNLFLTPAAGQEECKPYIATDLGRFLRVTIPAGVVRLTVPVPQALAADGVLLKQEERFEFSTPYLPGADDVRWTPRMWGVPEGKSSTLGYRFERTGAGPVTGSLDYG